ncbi:MAG: transcription-repair coupling factor [Bacteroidales bacterium]|nr:transcription-repair coupling factor [Bacteroidales bacterium]
MTMDASGLLKKYAEDERVARIRRYWNDECEMLTLKGLTASVRAVMAVAAGPRVNVFVCAEREDAPYVYYDIKTLTSEDEVFLLPSSFKHRAEATGYDARNVQLRAEAVSMLMESQNDPSKKLYVVTYPEAMAEKMVSRTQFDSRSLAIAKGDKISISFICEVLIEYGFNRVDFVFEPGQFSVRGSIVDVFSYADDTPYRIDFFGDEVDSIRMFELDTQLSASQREKIVIVPDISQSDSSEELMPLSAILPEDCGVWIEEPQMMRDLIDRFADNVKEGEENGKKVVAQAFCGSSEWFSCLKNKYLSITEKLNEQGENVSMGILPQPVFKKNFDLLEDDIYYKVSDGYNVYLLAENSRQLERLDDIFSERKRKLKYGKINIALHEGFVDTRAQICVYTDHQIFERYHKCTMRNDKMRSAQQAITLRELSMLNVGDYVVHVDHGIGVFGGLVTTQANGRTFEAIRLTFRDNDTLLVNVQSLHRISKYRGKDGVSPKVSKLGTSAWSRVKERTKSHVKDIARNLIELYAKRKDEQGFAFSPDSFLQTELEASFLYEDTPDQYKANMAIKADMEKPMPMDRLVCGDVGFGKTELAVRAAFKAVCDNKQVAVLVPTTVLAFQHYNTFSQRLKDLPCKVDYVSRLRKTSEVRNVSKQLAEGEVNIIIGTHKLIGKDIKFKDLGLLIIDEEQRFGVGVKEKLREMRVNVDTLTLSATPIPRTLQFSLMGARDLSVLNTPPANRQPIVTEVQTFSEDAMKMAVANEVERGGQVFIINNRIQHLFEIERIVNNLLPDVRTIVAHGQMDGAQLESIMLDFMNGDYDVLIATTIIESGLDIPNANTIIVNNAHQFGLSELHQLRGRVGRSNKKAYCYLFAPPMSVLTPEARRRLKIIEEYSDLGSGFSIAMQDLDIRGTGDVLGAEQSGFISDIGYETYQKILAEALVELKQNEYKEMFENENSEKPAEGFSFVADTSIETDIETVFPQEYINSISERMKLYRDLDNIQEEAQIDVFRGQLIDRFGPLPQSSEELLNAVKIRLSAQRIGIERIVFKNEKLLLYFVSDKNSAFYQSPIFTSIIGWFQLNSKRVRLKETADKLMLVPQGISTMKELLDLLVEIESYVNAK